MEIVVLTGAGISAESGLKTFRDADGLWEGHDVMEVASPQGWRNNQELVLDFYNQRRKQALTAEPNKGHLALAELEQHHDVCIITQNIDNLHEKAGSTDILHLHGELFKSRSTIDSSIYYDIDGWELNKGDLCHKGSQLRPDVVWFGEAVPLMGIAEEIVSNADVFIVVGTSMMVYPAAGLIDLVDENVMKIIVDPQTPNVRPAPNLHFIAKPASTGVPEAIKMFTK
ncbi:MAG: NAD-dependent deacylase [Cyclobacteriaceae bacterium]